MKLLFVEILYLTVEKLNNLFSVWSSDAYDWRTRVAIQHYRKKAKKEIEAVNKAEKGIKK